MRRFFLSAILIVAIQFISFGQSSEVEPNNSFSTASPLVLNDYTTASLGGGDDIDYHGVDFSYNANFYLELEITNTGSNGTQSLDLSIYNSLTINNEYVGVFSSSSFMVDEGETFYHTIYLCGLEADSFYLKFESTGDFEYTMRWYPANVYNKDDLYYLYNNTQGTASPFSYNIEEEASLGYEFWGSTNFDTVDYFTTTLPAANYDSVYLKIRAQSNQCSGTQWIKYFCYKNGSSTPFASGFVGDNPAVSSFQEVTSNIPLNNMQQGDNLLVKFVTNGTFGYRFIYRQQDIYDDDEDNCCVYNAIVLNEGDTKGGNVGEYNYNTDEYIDEYDTYRIILPQDGAIKLFVMARNDQCIQYSNNLLGSILDKDGNFLDNMYLSQWPIAFPCGQLRYDTMKLRGFAADTFYIQLSAGEKVSYTLKYEFLDATVSDSAEAYNSPISTVIPIAEGQVKKGHVRFKKTAYLFDASDIYRFNMPGDGSITVYMKATYRNDYSGTNNNNNNRLTFVTSNFTDRTPSNPPTSTLTPDAVYLDTFVVCGLGAGTNYFTISSSRAYEYEVHYVVNDTLTVQNDPEPNNFFNHAVPIIPNEVRSGRLRYFNDVPGGGTDNYDYYKTITPYKGRLKVYIQATSTACTTSTSRLTLNMYKDTVAAGLVSSRDLMNASNIPAGTTVYDTVYTCIFNPDTAYIRLEGTQTFRYQFRFEFVADTAEHFDPEPDNSFAQATRIGSGQTHLRHVGKTYSGVPDTYDYFKMVVHGPDTLKLRWHITNIGCVDNRIFRIWLYNRFGQLVYVTGYVLNGVGTLDAGQVVQGGFNWPYSGLDTAYIRYEGTGEFRYSFYTEPLKPSMWFNISGDSTVCEGGTYIYKATNVIDSNVTFHWSLPAGGGTLNATDSTATVVWNANGNRNIQLYLSNSKGSSPTLTQNIVVNGEFPTQTPVAYNFARTLSTNSLPPGATCQWYRNDTLIVGAVDSSYYAEAAGDYTVKFVNDCGPGPSSNIISFAQPAQPQTITFPHISTITMSPTAKAVLPATASSGLPVFYQKISGPGNIINDTLFITGVGTIIVKALQPGDDTYSAAPTVNDTITVIKGDQVISFDSIPDQIFDANKITLVASSSMGQGISYSIIAGAAYASVSSNKITKKGAGTVTVRASQNGNSNYNAAIPVERTFCIGVRTLTPIIGQASPCLATYRYNTQKIPGANFVWTLSGGGVLTTNNDTAWVQWQTPGTYTLTVKANSPCDTVYTNTQILTITTSNNLPGAVSNMLPANNAIDQQLPLTLSWIPGNNTVNYDLYLWDSAAAEPVTPYAANISDIQYIIPLNSGLPYNKTYKWKVVAKNPCWQTVGPIQQFRLIPLPDLMVSDVQAPATATSGQTVSISWKVTNIGPGRTMTDDTWYDGVYFALDTVPNVSFQGSPNWNPSSWNSLTANGRPLLLGKKQRPSSLDSGQFYTNTLDFTLPLQYSFPVYVYVITDNQHPNWKILQVSVANDTGRKQNPMLITLAPTPDLRVDSVFAPASVFSGSTINLTYKVKNYGVLTPAGSNWTDSIFISQNPLFDRNSAIPLTLPKFNDSYYPNALKANVSNNTQLLPDSFVTKNVQVVIPNYIFGTWFIYVKANAGTTAPFLYEGALSNNNLGQVQLQVYLTPTPKLVVDTITLPITSASTTQPVGANWSIKNEGFRDNIEKNRGHYFTYSQCIVPCPPGTSSPPGSVARCYAPSIIADSILFGSSYWLDRVYLSTDSNGLNIANATLVKEITHGIQNSGLYSDKYPSFVNCPADFTNINPQVINGRNININNVIQPGAAFAKAENFTIPSNMQPGNYYVYVYTNPTKTVFEYPGTPQIKRSSLPITVQRPDAVVSAISLPSNTIGGTTVTINYSVLNNGPGAVFNHARKDRLYISNFSNFDGSAQLISTNTFTESLPVGTAVPHIFTYFIPPATTGAKYFYVQTNYDSLFRETNATNNLSVSAMTTVSAAVPADLVVSNIQMPDTTFTIFIRYLTYTVTNNGTGTTAGTWTDSVFFSCSPSFNVATNNYMAKKLQTRAIPPGGSYTDTIMFTIPKMSYELNSCFPQTAQQSAYFYIKTNAGLTIYEGSSTNNNVTGSGSRPFTNPLVDHIVTSVSAPDTTTVGFAFPVSWQVKNIGYNPNNNYYGGWVDAIYFSADSIADGTDVMAGDYLKYPRLNRGQESPDSKSPYTPVLLTGNYYVYVKTNNRNSITAEKVLSNNVNFIRNESGAAKKIHVIRPELADLIDTIISAPASVAIGQPITVVYKITNNGTGTTYPGANLQNQLRLSDDFFANPNDGDRLLATRNRPGVLTPGQFYYDTVTVTIPGNTIPGNYVLISRANSNNALVESNTTNNLGFSLLNVFTPPITDLTVSNVVVPDTVMLGYTMDTARWVIANVSGEEARGHTSDGIYLSAGNLFDSTATLIGIKNKYINIQPLRTDTVKLAPLVTGVVEGNYNVFVKTDLLNQLSESDKDNNTGMTATPVYVKVKELPLNVNELNTLHKISRYYKLKIPDSLYGSTILVTLKSNDSLTMKNEMFIAGGYVPTPANYDYGYEIPNYGNQQIVMSDVTDSVYYIMVRCVSPNPLVQNITLKAVKLPFAILNVHTNSGGNIGNVTVRIRGSLYRDSMIAKLSNGTTTIYASAVYYTNSTQVFATFPLQGRPLGVYDVTLIKPDSSVAVLPNGFSIVPANNGGLITGGGVNTGAGNGNAAGCDPGAASGLNSQLVVELVVPSRVLIKRPVVILINYSNPTNFDIPAQSRILYSEAGIKMAFTRAGIPTGTTSLYLELVEPGGPPGIIRAGGSGTIIVHCNAPDHPPQPNTFVLFKLK
ncbi:MAG: hypothetical protein IPP02_05205 [Chitinophagaceae bacterium]|nr:hypothetical protein [Chitinophagaceae bacterium]